jgi:DNA repair exonuclease SbcCD ATPase subunit
MKINSIKVKGLLSFKNETKFDFGDDKIFLVTGRIGSGKSTLFSETFSFLFDGKPYRKDMIAKDMINDSSKISEVEIIFDDNNSITRKKDNSYDVTLNNKNIGQYGVENIFGEKDLFFSSVVFGQGFGGFVYYSDKQKKEFITKFSLGFVDKYIEKAQNIEKDINNTVADKQNKIIVYEEHIKEYILELEKLGALYSEYWTLDREKNESIVTVIEETRKSIKEIETIYLKQKEVCLECISMQNKINGNIFSFKEERDRIKKDDGIILQKIAVMESDIKHIVERIKEVENAEVCPFCFSELDVAVRIRALLQLNHELQQIEEAYKIFENRHNKKLERMQLYDGRITAAEKYRNDVVNSVDYFKQKLQESKTKIDILNDRLNNSNYSCNSVNPYEILLKEENKKKINLIREIDKIKKELAGNNKNLKACVYWINKLREFKSAIFSNILYSLSELSNEYLNFISDGKFGIKITASLKTTEKRIKDLFDINIFQGESIVNFSRLSGGEKKEVAFAVNIAFIQSLNVYLANKFDLLVLDEVFENLDEFAKDKVVDILFKLQKTTGKTIVLITHDSFVVEGMDGVCHIEVVNDGGISSYRRI